VATVTQATICSLPEVLILLDGNQQAVHTKRTTSDA
jgi:hypothetical protein